LIKTGTHRLKPDPGQQLLLKAYQREAACCWNAIVETANYYYRITHKWIGKNELQKWVKGWFELHSNTVQALTDKFCANRQTTARLRKNGNPKARYPYRTKRFATIPFKQTAIAYTAEGTLRLTLSRGVRLDTGIKPAHKVRTCEIIWRGNHYGLNYTCESKGADYCLLEGDKAGAW